MTWDQGIVFAILGGSLVAFAWGRWRYDLVAIAALLAAVVGGVVEADEAFLGFGHPAVVTVVAVLVIGKGLERSGLVSLVTRRVLSLGGGPLVQTAVLCGLVVVASSFINNVGALALFLPVALRVSRETEQPPSRILMPLAFSSLLGGLTTLVGTPPNIIIATARREVTGESFGMFDFAPVGVAIALIGFLFMVFVGGRLVPVRRAGTSPEDLFDVGRYLTELRVPEGSAAAGRSVGAVVAGADVIAVSLIRGDVRVADVHMDLRLEIDDLILVEGDPGIIDELVAGRGLELAPGAGTTMMEGVALFEAVVPPESRAVGSTAARLQLRIRHRVNLLGVARAGRSIHDRLAQTVFEGGDVLLLQGGDSAVRRAIADLGLLPLATRALSFGTTRRLATATGLFAIAITATVMGLVPVQIALALAAVAMVVSRVLSLDGAYRAVDLPIVVLLGAMIPVGEALASTGGAEIVADGVAVLDRFGGPTVVLAGLLTIVMLLSNIINNAAAAVIAAPVAAQLAGVLDVSADPLLMAVAVGASLPLLTPIGHQSNLLVMAPGGYRFGDYWRLGLPMSVLAVAVGSILITTVFPFAG